MPRVLHILSQRPQQTGSGVTLEALIACGNRRGWQQAAVIGIPSSLPAEVDGLSDAQIFPLWFESPRLPFAVPGMSDTMPYTSSRFSDLGADELATYRVAMGEVIADAIATHRPDVIHANHIWLATAVARKVAADIPICVHSHGTGLRQLKLCPHLADEVIASVRLCDHFFALHGRHADEIAERLAIESARISSIGAGYRSDIFATTGTSSDAPASRVAYAGKLARAKGVPWLIEAIDRLATRRRVSLELAGGGDNDDAAAIRRLAANSAVTTLAGRLDQSELAALLNRSDVFVLPSFFEGLPLVLVEALACGVRLVATDLPGVRELASVLGDHLDTVTLPRLVGPDEPNEQDLGAFVDRLERAIEAALVAGRPPAPGTVLLKSLSWDAVFDRVERTWLQLIAA